MIVHALKTLPQYFQAVADGDKTFEIRSKEDGEFKVGDLLALNEYKVACEGGYTGRCLIVRITYILDNPEYYRKDMVAMGLEPCKVIDLSRRLKNESLAEYGIPVYGGEPHAN